jgi:hypothetical protein
MSQAPRDATGGKVLTAKEEIDLTHAWNTRNVNDPNFLTLALTCANRIVNVQYPIPGTTGLSFSSP